jgi:peptide/nickel transport system substrate-binding protein
LGGLSRRRFLALTAVGALRAPAVHAQKRLGTLRFVPHADLKILDPIWTTAYITRNHGYMVYDTLFALDVSLRIRPQMVETYRASADRRRYVFTLRPGLRFHDGPPVTAEDCVASLRRWGARDPLGRLLMAALSRLAPIDQRTFELALAEPFGLVLEALAKPSASPPFIMPARLAATDPHEQIQETIGSGPFRFQRDEWEPGHRVIYVRNPDYVPRDEAPSGAAGGKRVRVDRVEWRYIPDPATTGAALEAGEIDFWENVPLDFAPRLEKNPAVRVLVTDPRGSMGILRPNHLQPPFNDKRARQALLWLVDQLYYLRATIGQPAYYRACPGLFMCGGMPYESTAGAPARPDLERARRLLADSGYDGTPLVILDPTDSPYAHAPALVTAELLQKIGAIVDLQAMDWSTLVARRAKKEPPAQGGWNIFPTWATAFDVMTPAVSAPLSGAGEQAWFGWPTSKAMEGLRREWVQEIGEARRRALAEQIQRLAFDEVPFVPWGQFQIPAAFRKTVQGVLQFGATLLWNLSV